jgi:hypothetical protein
VEAEVTSDFPDADVEPVEGSGGIFDIVLDGETIFSRGSGRSGKRFPRPGETSLLIRNHQRTVS